MAYATYEGPNPNPGKDPHVSRKEMIEASADRLPERWNRWAYKNIVSKLIGKSVI